MSIPIAILSHARRRAPPTSAAVTIFVSVIEGAGAVLSPTALSDNCHGEQCKQAESSDNSHETSILFQHGL